MGPRWAGPARRRLGSTGAETTNRDPRLRGEGLGKGEGEAERRRGVGGADGELLLQCWCWCDQSRVSCGEELGTVR